MDKSAEHSEREQGDDGERLPSGLILIVYMCKTNGFGSCIVTFFSGSYFFRVSNRV